MNYSTTREESSSPASCKLRQSAEAELALAMDGPNNVQVQVMSRRVVRADPPAPAPTEEVHLTPWDLQMLALGYIQSGLLLPKPNRESDAVVGHLASAFAGALGLFYPFAGRLVVVERGAADGSTATAMSLRCTCEGAEFVHAAAPSVTAADITAGAPLYIPRELVSSLFPLNGLLSVDAASSEADGSRRAPVLAAQVTELADALFVAVSLNHAVGDGTTFWHFVNTWSELARGDGAAIERPLPVLERWFLEDYPVPVPLQFAKIQHIRRRGQPTPLQECAFHFSHESVKMLKARANAEVAHSGAATATATVSSLQALLAHLWRSVCRARRLEPSQKTTYVLLLGCRGRVKGVPQTGYVGNAVVAIMVTSTAGEVLEKGLGWTSSLLNSAVASFDEAAFRDWLEQWTRQQRFTPTAGGAHSAAPIFVGSSPRFDVYGNDFGWGKPVAVRSGPGNKVDGKSTVYEGRGGDGAIYLEVCLAPDALARLVADDEFMDAVTTPPQT